MKKIRPFGIAFLVIQSVLLLVLWFMPGHMAHLKDPGMGGLVWLALFLIAAFLILLMDAIWVAVVLRRYHARHREVPPSHALVAWGIYLVLAVAGGPCVNFMVLLGGAPSLTMHQWAVFCALCLIPALIPATILWVPALLLSILDPNYRYTPKPAEPQV